MEHAAIENFLLEVKTELLENILPFWMESAIDLKNGGFLNSITNDLRIDVLADKGCILNSRILWTFSSAYRAIGSMEYLGTAQIAYRYLMNYFWDSQYSGVYMMVDYKGDPVDTRKQVYNLAFAIYGLSEFYRATGLEESLVKAVELFKLIETYSYDKLNGGYIEALSCEWNSLEDLRLSDKDENEKKSMNTHLHVLEAYTNLYRVWKDDFLKERLTSLLHIMLEKVLDLKNNHFMLFFNEEYHPRSTAVSFGHDIEGSWLLCEAAEILGDRSLMGKTYKAAGKMAEVTLSEGFDRKFGGIFNESKSGSITDDTKVWWVQAEAMVGFVNAYGIFGNKDYLNAAYNIWDFCKNHLIDNEYGEWYWKTERTGKPIDGDLKVEPWKCPYHNGRACMELIERLQKIDPLL